MRKWKKQFFSRKWGVINEEVAHMKRINCRTKEYRKIPA
jgi:hypothetical protein